MRKTILLVFLVSAFAGCEDAPQWLRLTPRRSETPVSVPKAEATTAPASQPAGAAAAADAPAPPVPPAPAPAAARPTPAPPEAPARPAPAPPPAPAGSGPVMAYANGVPIYMDTLTRLLVAGYGLELAQQLIANELVRQEAARKGVSIDEADVQAEHERTLGEMFGQVQDANQRERLLEQLLDRNKVSREQWNLTMRRNALLAKLAEKAVTVTEDDLKAEFARQYETKVEVQHIQTPTLADAQKVLRELANGEEFTKLVHKYSVGPSAQSGGVLAPFGRKDTGTPPALREAALAMRKIGEVSDPIQVGTAFHIIKLLRIIEPEEVRFADVRGQLLAAVRKRKLRALQQEILQILLRGARIEYVDPTLRRRAEKGSGQ